MEKTLIKERLDALRGMMKKRSVDYYIVPTADFHHSEYVDDYFKVREFLSGFTGSNGTLVVSQKEAGLWTDGRYFIQAEKELEGTGIILFKMQEEGVPSIAEYLLAETKKGDTIGFDGRVVETAFGKGLEKKLLKRNVKFYYSEDLSDEIWQERPKLPAHPVTILPEDICGISVDEKLMQVRSKMWEKDCEYFLLSKLDDLMWLLNIRGKDVECNPVALSYGFITRDTMYFFLQKEEETAAFCQYAKVHGIIIKDYDDIVPFLEEYDYQGKVLADEKSLSYLLYKIVSEHTELVNGPNPTEILKSVKNSVELEKMRDIYLKDSVAVTKFIYWLKKSLSEGKKVTELSAAAYLDNLRALIPEYLDLSFPTISAYKENAAMMHYEATEECFKELKAEGMLLVDSGGQYLGGTTDVTRTIVLGEISDSIIKHYSVVAAGMVELMTAKFLYGCTGRNLDILARKPLWDMGIDYKCGTGHGVGYILNVHEGPQSIRWRYIEGTTETVLEEGMTVTDEPGVYIEGSHGIRIENVLVVKKEEKNSDGQFMTFENLTYVPIERLALDKKYLSAESVRKINEYHRVVYEKIAPYLNAEEAEWLKEETLPL